MARLPSEIRWTILLLGLLLSSDLTAASPISIIRRQASTNDKDIMMIDNERVTDTFTTKLFLLLEVSAVRLPLLYTVPLGLKRLPIDLNIFLISCCVLYSFFH